MATTATGPRGPTTARSRRASNPRAARLMRIVGLFLIRIQRDVETLILEGMCMRRLANSLLIIALLSPGLALAQQGTRSFYSGYAGTLPSDPKLKARTYFDDTKVRALIYEMEGGPVARSRVVASLDGSPFTIDDLVRVKLLREEGDRYFIGFNYFNAQDQVAITTAGRAFIPSLVRAYVENRLQLNRLLARYPVKTVGKDRLGFILLAGFSLNWDGLKITREKGYRKPVLVEGPGFRYSFWASEEISNHNTHGFYWGSSTFPGGGYDFKEPTDYSFSSFGDPYSDPRMNFPDLMLMPATDMKPGIRAASIKIGLVNDDSFGHFTNVIGPDSSQDLARILFALRTAPAGAEKLASLVHAPAKIDAYLNLLIETEYVLRNKAGVYHLKIPVLDRQDAAMVTAVLGFSRRILEHWLAVNYPKIRTELGTLTALRQGVPFESLFTQIWHELFGLATQQLVRSGVMFDPAGRLVRYKGSCPIIWRRALYDLNPD
jgi:hypothetical protein